MPWRKAILVYFVLVTVIYGLLLIPWPGLMAGYRKAVAAMSNTLLGRIGEARMTFEPMADPRRDKDTDVTVRHMSRGLRAQTVVNIGRTYLPVALAIALVVAAPIPWNRKLIALVLALILMAAYVLYGIWLRLMVNLLSQPQFMAVHISETTRSFLKTLEILNKSPVLPYIISVVAFGLAAVRREDIVRLVAAQDSSSAAKS